MRKRHLLFLLLLLISTTLLFILLLPTEEPAVRIAAWNLQVYGDAKASDPALLAAYAGVIRRYDIVVLQEIRDADGSSIVALCALLDGYACNATSRAGRSSSKEQYVFAYRNATLLALDDHNPDPQDRWERPPARATFLVGNRTITLYAIHTKPTDAPREIRALQRLVEEESPDGSVLVLGDLNADCAYYDPKREDAFDGWRWVIDEDTTTGRSDCAYDRIFSNTRYPAAGVDRMDITAAMSDHYPVWVGLT